ncbi:dihydrofolate reductase family protein [Actinomadura luteofluorescens]|uniref:dihydrofolate reductase family protein n=1 Tax=Actinomadura luteofluorescens TaxID=46163 RepID=UPI00362F5403
MLSTTLAEAPWERTRVVNAPAADVVGELRAEGGGDILVNSSASVIKPLLAADLVDRLYLMVLPEIAGGGGGCSRTACRPPGGRSAAGRPASWVRWPWSTTASADPAGRGRGDRGDGVRLRGRLGAWGGAGPATSGGGSGSGREPGRPGRV